MATADRGSLGSGAPGALSGVRSPAGRRLGIVVILAAIAVLWEGLKWLAGDPWRLHGTAIDYEHVPPFSLRIASDLSLPHIWDIVNAFIQPTVQGVPLWEYLLGHALFTFQEALVGFALGTLLGLGLSIVFVP